ncbi:MAG: hypothetical protein EOM80_14185 [Erysipelotrichia bacterium]|nr:hypothetical protein [Erysipelotrichia bacterium]
MVKLRGLNLVVVMSDQFKNFIDRYRDLSRRLLPSIFLPVKVERIKKEIERKFGETTPKMPCIQDLEETWNQIKKHLTHKKPLSELPRRALRRLSWLLYYPREQPQKWFVHNENLVEELFKLYKKSARPASIISLLHSFLLVYPTEIKTFEAMRNGIEKLVSSSKSCRLGLWQARCEEFSLLALDGPARVAGKFLDSGASCKEIFDKAGFTGELTRAGFITGIHKDCLTLVKKRLEQGTLSVEAIKQVFDFISPDGRELRFPEFSGRIADSFLLPFYEGAEPASEILNVIKTFFLEKYGHPEIDHGRWNSVSEGARQTMIRWVVKATFEAFFRILDHTAHDDHWRYRRAFWGAYLLRGYISGVWLVLGPSASIKARQFINTRYEKFGQLTGNNISSDHSVLLLQIGNLVFSEWSHNGKCRVWQLSDPDAPKRLRPRYSREDLVYRPLDEFVHSHSESGSWQRKIAYLIREHTDIQIDLRQLMP